MNDLAEQLRAITDDPPPTSINLDHLITSERRRGRILRVGGGVAAAAAAVTVLATVVGAWPGTGGGPSTAGSGGQSCAPAARQANLGIEQSWSPVAGSMPTELPEQAVNRLTQALHNQLGPLLPAGTQQVDMLHQRCDEPVFQWHPHRKYFELEAALTDDSGTGQLGVVIWPTPAEQPQDCEAALSRLINCTARTEPDGSKVVTSFHVNREGVTTSSVKVFRPDNTMVTLSVNNAATELRVPPSPDKTKVKDPVSGKTVEVDDVQDGGSGPKLGRPEPFLTLDQLVAIGLDPALTIYP